MPTLRKGNVKLAVRSIKSAKTRSLLTMLGIVIGVTAVVCVVCIGQGVKDQVESKVGHFGKNLITVQPGADNTAPSVTNLLGGGSKFVSAGFLTTNDIKVVSRTHDVGTVVPLGTLPGSLRGDHLVNNPLIIATSDAFPSVIDQKINFGSFFSTSDQVSGIVLGSKLAAALFDDSVPIGRAVTFRGQNFVVEGVFDQFDATPFSLTSDFNSAAFIPYNKALNIAGNSLAVDQILSKPVAGASVSTVAKAIQSSLNRAHGGAQDTTVLTQSDSLVASDQIVHLMTLLTVGVAIIALLVGGVGIMDVMLVSVTERMHEIGVRKAIGASQRQILTQFMTESLVLSLVGAVIGVFTSLTIVGLLRVFTSLQPVLVWQAFVLAALLAVVVGVIFGTAPAVKAARKDPIDALRHE